MLPRSEVEAARRQLDELVFQQEYEASFVNFVGRIYYNFLQGNNCKPLRYNPLAPLMICYDFNVDPGVAVILQEQRIPGEYERDRNGIQMLDRPIIGTGVIGEVWIPANSNTPAVNRKIIQDWGDHKGQVIVFGDATGGSRGTAQTEGSDWDLVRRDLSKQFGDRLFFEVDKSNPTERARVNAMNSRCKSANGEIRFAVDPRQAPHLVTDLEGVRALEGGSGEIDKKHDPMLTHISDAVGYYVAKRFPVADRSAIIRPLHM